MTDIGQKAWAAFTLFLLVLWIVLLIAPFFVSILSPEADVKATYVLGVIYGFAAAVFGYLTISAWRKL